MTFGSWAPVEWGYAVLALLAIAGLAWSMPTILRIALVPFVLMEFYFMTPMFACGGSLNMLDRAPGTHSACTKLDYANYLGANFGISNAYVLAAYGLLALFMVWPLLKKMVHANKDTLAINAALQKVAFDESIEMAKIKRIGKI